MAFQGSDLNFTHSYTYSYAYTPTGNVTSQTMTWGMVQPGTGGGQSGQSFSASYQWDNEGKMTSYSDLGGNPFGYQYDGMGRMNGSSAQSCGGYTTDSNGNWYCDEWVGIYSAAATYNAANQLSTLTYSSYWEGPYAEQFTYNALGQVTELKIPSVMDMQYNYTAGANNGRIASAVDNTKPETTSYTYDALNRLTNAQSTLGWSEAYTYDGFSNLTSINGAGPPADPTTNRQVGVSYDANGNPTGNQYVENVWDEENRMTEQLSGASGGYYGGASYSYDPWGRRVEKNLNPDPQGINGGTGFTGTGNYLWEFYFYGPGGRKLATIGCTYVMYAGPYPQFYACTVTEGNVYFAGKLVGWNSGLNPQVVPVATDRLGSVRADTPGRSTETMRYYPYGTEQMPTTPDDREKFGTYYRDAPGQDYAQQRYYNGLQGRFWSPDPGGITAAKLSHPGSFNQYAYVGGDPINSTDPRGFMADDPGAEYCAANDWDPACYGPCGTGGLPSAGALFRALRPLDALLGDDADPGCGPSRSGVATGPGTTRWHRSSARPFSTTGP